MRILVVSNGFPPRGRWGTEFYTAQMVAGLRERGHEVAVLHPDRSGSSPRYTVEEVKGEGDVDVFLLHNTGDPGKAFDDSYSNRQVDRVFGEVIERWQPELVHFTYLLWGLSIGMPEVARARGLSTVLTTTDYGLLCHRGQMFDWHYRRCGGPHPAEVCARCVREFSRDDAPPVERALRRALVAGLAAMGGLGMVVTTADLEQRAARVAEALAAVDHVILPTRVLGEAFARSGVPADRMTDLVYGIDDRPYHAARTAPPAEPVVFGYLGQFTPHKGLDVLVEAVHILQHRLPESVEPWFVRLYGSAAGGRHTRYAPRVLGKLSPRMVTMKAFSPEQAPTVLAELHALIMPSLWDENAPLTCLQARAAGIPMLASDVRGISEVIEHGEHGLLFPPGDAAALADAMREVILGRLGRHPNPSLPVGLDEHLDVLEGIYDRVAH
ncbi:glycosyltransferase [Engelhardtia mirabilis]|uniref:Alpha-D-kanosaminyltransferase n=1 Tax=Engelhardtia mirabilis TaxID=2528011 RepID=A0A518BIG9_9BACT|nr:Alpha-D-kanosaminyltransferase [Planctomycetes bacterium Pla133]QDV01097.1 Alpha-D-kanosaminyltransferase [Planctomycetes bacterium Pla86]